MTRNLRDLLDMATADEDARGFIAPDNMTGPELATAKARIIADHLDDVPGQPSPRLIYVTGQAGSGKSTVAQRLGQELARHGRYVRVDFDALRSYHPRYLHLARQDSLTAAKKTNAAGKKLTIDLLKRAIDRRANVLFDNIAMGQEMTDRLLQPFRDAGYMIEAVAIVEPDAACRLGVASRYENALAKAARMGVNHHNIPRWVSTAEQSRGPGNLAGTLTALDNPDLVDVFQMRRRNGSRLYYRHGGANQAGISPADIARSVTTSTHAVGLVDGWQQVLTQMQRRSAPEADITRIKNILTELSPPPTPVY